jgi:type II secretory pathway component PulK
MKVKRSVLVLLLVFALTLITITGCLYQQTLSYKSVNRTLILQNDSLIGVVIELNRKVLAND